MPRPDLQRLIDRHAFTLDAARPEAMAKRHALGLRSARENIADLCDAGSFSEYGALAVAAQQSRRSEDDLMRHTPADGMVTGIGSINGAQFGSERSRAVVMAYDATVLAGTQGFRNHQKTDRMLGLALEHRLPVVLFAEGGGGRPGDVDMRIVAGLHVPTFASFARLNGRVPVLGVVAGSCFAGNAALLGCCDVVIATRDSNIGMGGPAMIEGGGLGVVRPEQIGPSTVQHANGVIDLLCDNEAQAVAAARQYLSYFQGPLAEDAAQAPDALSLRAVVPENRVRAYDTRVAINGLFDPGSVLYLRTGFGAGIHTALARIGGRPVGVIANNPSHLGGAIDADAADKAARFMQLCNAHGLPIVSLVDTPGFMVGPEIETRAQVRHVSRMFVAAAHLRVPVFAVVLRKGYGLGAMAMCAGGFHVPRIPCRGPPVNSAAWGWRARCGWAGARSWRRCPKARSATRCSSSWWQSSTRPARPSTWPRRWRLTRSSTRLTPAPGCCAGCSRRRCARSCSRCRLTPGSEHLVKRPVITCRPLLFPHLKARLPCPDCCPTSTRTACSSSRSSTPTARSTTCRAAFRA